MKVLLKFNSYFPWFIWGAYESVMAYRFNVPERYKVTEFSKENIKGITPKCILIRFLF